MVLSQAPEGAGKLRRRQTRGGGRTLGGAVILALVVHLAVGELFPRVAWQMHRLRLRTGAGTLNKCSTTRRVRLRWRSGRCPPRLVATNHSVHRGTGPSVMRFWRGPEHVWWAGADEKAEAVAALTRECLGGNDKRGAFARALPTGGCTSR